MLLFLLSRQLVPVMVLADEHASAASKPDTCVRMHGLDRRTRLNLDR